MEKTHLKLGDLRKDSEPVGVFAHEERWLVMWHFQSMRDKYRQVYTYMSRFCSLYSQQLLGL